MVLIQNSIKIYQNDIAITIMTWYILERQYVSPEIEAIVNLWQQRLNSSITNIANTKLECISVAQALESAILNRCLIFAIVSLNYI